MYEKGEKHDTLRVSIIDFDDVSNTAKSCIPPSKPLKLTTFGH